MSRSKLNPTQIAQFTYDDVNQAVKVKIQDAEINMELNQADGDSVTAHPVKLTASVLGVANPADNNTFVIPALDCSGLTQIRVDINGSGTAEVYVSPNDSGTYFYLLGSSGSILNVCARRVKVKSITAAGDIHLVGRSS